MILNKDGNIKLKEICDRLGYVDIADFVKLRKYFFVDYSEMHISHADYNYELDKVGKFKFIIVNTKDTTIKLDLHKNDIDYKKNDYTG